MKRHIGEQVDRHTDIQIDKQTGSQTNQIDRVIKRQMNGQAIKQRDDLTDRDRKRQRLMRNLYQMKRRSNILLASFYISQSRFKFDSFLLFKEDQRQIMKKTENRKGDKKNQIRKLYNLVSVYYHYILSQNQRLFFSFICVYFSEASCSCLIALICFWWPRYIHALHYHCFRHQLFHYRHHHDHLRRYN